MFPLDRNLHGKVFGGILMRLVSLLFSVCEQYRNSTDVIGLVSIHFPAFPPGILTRYISWALTSAEATYR